MIFVSFVSHPDVGTLESLRPWLFHLYVSHSTACIVEAKKTLRYIKFNIVKYYFWAEKVASWYWTSGNKILIHESAL